MNVVELIKALRVRTVKKVREEFPKGLTCPAPNCKISADRPECFWKFDNCPRKNPDAHAALGRWVYEEVPDKLCQEAAS